MGKLFVIEGVDGSGKQTQTELLYNRLLKEGFKIKKASFPNYKSNSSALVKMYLNGDFGKNPDDIDAYISSTFFAVDRYATYKTDFEEFYNNGGIILTDRYTTSNMVHQASKIDSLEEKNKFFTWLLDLEYRMYGIPTPSKVFFLDLAPDISLKLIKDRANKITDNQVKDIHEASSGYIVKSYLNAVETARTYNWDIIKCSDENKLRTIEDINKDIYEDIIKEII